MLGELGRQEVSQTLHRILSFPTLLQERTYMDFLELLYSEET